MMTAESERLFLATEDRLGIKADEGDLEKFRRYLVHTYGENYESQDVLEKTFHSGEAAGFLTVNETYFFREQAHFAFLQKLLPSFHGSVTICSAATATGCEAYSIAMMIEHYNRGNPPLSWHIDAFDINPHVIEIAKKGIYGKHSFREDGSCFRYIADVYLKKSGDVFEVAPSLRDNIHFFVHNILDPLEGKNFPAESGYDLIFFRNAFIYFSPRSRIKIISNLASSLKEQGKLIMGVSETAGVNPAEELVEKVQEELFYFQKPDSGRNSASFFQNPVEAPLTEFPKTVKPKKINKELPIDPAAVGDIINDEKTAADLAEKIWKSSGQSGHEFNGNELAAAVLFLLNRGDFSGADRILGRIEASGDSAFSAFLRGEYFYLQDMFIEAEFHYKLSLDKNDAFWPALYRISSLAPAEVLRKYRAGQALESLHRGMNLQYEVFIGGFSPDYYRGALLKQTQNAG